MKKPAKRISDLVSPRQQRNWDWRAAANFIAGGAGGSLLLFASIGEISPDVSRVAILLGMALIGAGLTCVWFEIGRPWRALNVYRHFATSWMTREAVVALILFPVAGLAMLTLTPFLVSLAGFLGLAFLYSQARILAANKGIPTWRHPRSIPLMVTTGLTEGAGFMVCVASLSSTPIAPWLLVSLITLISIRVWGWHMYIAGLTNDGVPVGALTVLNGLTRRLVVLGHGLPALGVAAALSGAPGGTLAAFAAGLLVVASGWMMKYTLVRRAAFTQGLALLHLPVRGGGPAGPATKPGWKAVAGA